MSSITDCLSNPKNLIATALGLIVPATAYTVMSPPSWGVLAFLTISAQALTHCSPNVISRCRTYRKLSRDLQRWCDDAPLNVVDGVTERNRRLAAKDRIKECFVNNGSYLNLQGLELSSIPPELNTLTRLESLNISHNQLTALPPELCSLKNLQYLHASNNRLTAFPLALTNLKTLALGTNQLETLPMSINKLAQLQKINLENNHITILPEFGNLRHLWAVKLGHNPLTTLPLGFFSLPISCIIETDGCPLSDRTLQQIRLRTTASDYNGPFFSHFRELRDATKGPSVDRWADWAS